MNCSNRDFDEVFILKSLINREFFLIIVIVYDSIEAGQPYCVGHRSCFGTACGLHCVKRKNELWKGLFFLLFFVTKINVKKAREKCKEKCAVRNGTLRQR